MKKTSLETVVAVVAVAAIAWAFIPRPERTPEPTTTGVLPANPTFQTPPEQPTGYFPQPEKTREFLESLPEPTIRDAGPDLFRPQNSRQQPPAETKAGVPSGDGIFLYRAFVKTYRWKYGKDWTCGQQGIGDCVSWGWHHGVAIASAVEYQAGNLDDWKLPATESIYGGARVEASGKSGDGSRPVGGYNDGSYGAAAAKWVHERGGILYREKYEKFDLSTYSASRAKEWGAFGNGGKGDAGWADELAKKTPVARVALVRNFDEAAAAIRSGYPVPVCSGQGFRMARDEKGFAAPSGTWWHCMCFIGVRYDRPGLLCLNSWGTKMHTGPRWPDDQPEGSFWVDAGVATRMLSGGDSFAVSATSGFPYRPLDNASWVSDTFVLREGL